MSDQPSLATPLSSVWANRKCFLVCCLVSMANLEYGLDSGVIGTLQAIPGFLAVFGYPDQFIPGGYGLNASKTNTTKQSTFQQLITSLPILGGLISSLASGLLSTYVGRRPGLWIACLFTLIGVAIQMSTDNKGAIYLGRFVLGLGNGFLQTFSNIYCAEVAPAHLRAIMVGLSTEWILIGSILAAAITNATQVRLDKSSFQIPLGVLLVLPVVLAVGLFFVPETPRYLIDRGQSGAARRALEMLRGSSLRPEELELEFVEMVKGIEEEKRLAGTLGPLDVFRETDRRRTLLCLGVSTADSGGSGAWFLIPYVTYFMLISGVPVRDVFHYYIINTCLGLVVCNAGLFLMRHVCGRRTFLMLGAALNGLCMLGLAVSSTVVTSPDTARACLVAFVSLFLIVYSLATGVATRPVATELVSTRLRAWSFGLTVAVGHLNIWLVSFCTPYFINPENLHWGGKYGYIWTASNLICLVWYYFFVPEMKGRSLEEIDELFEKRVATLDFKGFQTGIREEAVRDIQSGGHRDAGGETKSEPAVAVQEHQE
ncbi:general substrate transporter [Podospora appendiculata]|uniref:General substrate transporter n=1 Tax=Podospora appendiculata TaxID=314037 RepID=A0AAE1CCM4_9PEZI|nr:general substrate transporter [Podospora appendiculata]